MSDGSMATDAPEPAAGTRGVGEFAEGRRVDIGDRVNEIIRAAEAAARQVREDADAYAAEKKQAVDSYAAQRRRDFEAEVARLQRDAETQARTIREAAEKMAKHLEAEARRKQQELDQGSRAIAAHLETLLGGIKETGSQLEALMRRSKGGESLVSALSIDRRRLSTDEREH